MKKLIIVVFPMILIGILAGVISTRGGTATESYLDVTASITAPDMVAPGTDFFVDVAGAIVGGDPFSVFSYAVYQDAGWSYDANHLVNVVSGIQIEADGFNFGSEHQDSYLFNLPAGDYKFTYVFGWRSSGHNWYDVAVDIWVTVAEGGQDEDEDSD